MRRAPKKVASQLRIIGGMWRGRKLRFPDRPGLRPTGDRVRETLFNWLEPELAGAYCLDLFAGSGALGIEALSRGAARCDFVDADREALTAVEQHLNTLDASDRSTLQCGSAAEYLSAAQGGWDIVFVDPPFEAQLGESTLQQIATAGCLSNNNRVYYETSLSNPEPIPEMLYEVVREKTAGDVRYQLLTLRRA
jgi:16S rRNA (guanine966-N2)-methyltransferase